MWKHLLGTLLMLFVLSSESLATDYHVRPSGGNDLANGLTYASAWKTITKANASIAGGDRVYLWPGIHTGKPDPAASPTGGARFTYIGAGLASGNPIADTLTRATILVPGGSLSKGYVTVKGVTITGDYGCSETGDRDSILYCTINGSFVNSGGDYSIYDHLKVMGPRWVVNKWNLSHSDGIKIFNCEALRLGRGLTGAQEHTKLYWDADSTVEMFNKFDVTHESERVAGDGCEWHFDSRNQTSRGNVTRYHLNRDVYAVWRYRTDSSLDGGCFSNTFDADSFYADGTGRLSGSVNTFLPSSSANCGAGTYAAQCIGAWNSSIDSCLFNAAALQGASAFYFQGGMWNYDISYTTIAMNGPALEAFDVKSDCVVNHNTFVGSADAGGHSGGGVVRFTDEYNRPAFNVGALTFTNNIVSTFTLPVAGDISSKKCAIWFSTTKLDSAAKMHGQDKATVQNNLYSYYGYEGVIADRSGILRFLGNDVKSSPGDSTATNVRGRFDNRYRLDSLSVYGSPRFVDSTQANFNPALAPDSRAIGNGASGSDIGAVAAAAQGSLDAYPTSVVFQYGTPATQIIQFYNNGTATVSIEAGQLRAILPAASQDFLSVGFSESQINAATLLEGPITYDGAGQSGLWILPVAWTYPGAVGGPFFYHIIVRVNP